MSISQACNFRVAQRPFTPSTEGSKLLRHGPVFRWATKMRVKKRTSVTTSVALVACMTLASCAAAVPKQAEEEQVFELGRDDQLQVRIPAVNKGLGTTPESLNVSFNTDELKRFLGMRELPLPAQALALLQRRNCHGDMGDAHFSIRMSGGLDHTIKMINARRKHDSSHEHQINPRFTYGLLNYGERTYNGVNYVTNDILYLPEGERPYGFEMQCGLLDSPLEGGCTVQRDMHKLVDVTYHLCESLLPFWREMDDLYFELVRRIVTRPVITSDYKVKLQ